MKAVVTHRDGLGAVAVLLAVVMSLVGIAVAVLLGVVREGLAAVLVTLLAVVAVAVVLATLIRGMAMIQDITTRTTPEKAEAKDKGKEETNDRRAH
jgi:hypothetical protein